MKGLSAIVALAAASSVLAVPGPLAERQSNSQIIPITVRGNAFFQGEKRFYLRGVDYQPGGPSKLENTLATESDCRRDISKFIKLGINTVRIYSVDNSQSHDACMKLLADAGIYLVLDVNTPLYSLNRADPHTSYNAEYLQNVFATVEAFAKFNNTLAFFSANEVINDDTTTSCAPYVKAVTRDIRQYLRRRGHRAIPVGYSAADVDSNRLEMAQYMNCGTDDERSDFFGFNDYSWCSPSSFKISGWDQKVKNFTGYGLPIFLSEYGCNTNTRDWSEVESLYSQDMTPVYSGGLAYEYSQEANKYGLVEISGNDVKELGDFQRLQEAFAKTPNPSGDGGYNRTAGASRCPAQSPNWNVSSDALPALPRDAARYMEEGAGRGVGFGGRGSQTSGSGKSDGAAQQGSGSVGGVASGVNSTASPTGSGNAASSLRQAPLDMSPFAVSAIFVACTTLGAFML